MNKKIAVGIINTSNFETYQKCKNSITLADYIFSVHHTTDNIKEADVYNRYISYGGLYNILLRQILQTDADYIFLIKSNMLVENNSIFADYINAAKIFGTWFMSRGEKQDKYLPIEDDKNKVTINLYENLSNNFIFMLRSHVKILGYFNEGYTNLANRDDVNNLEIYDFYHRLEHKINYLPKGYFPDAELSLAKVINQTSPNLRPTLKEYTTDNITRIYGQFYYTNKFVPGQHKTINQADAISRLEKIQQIYGTNI